MLLTPLSKKRATDEVYDSLRAAILARLFQPGQRLLADEIAHQLGVSMTPIRHALQQLAVEGLVEIHPRSGTYVARISAEDLSETFEIRLALELLAGQRAMARITPQHGARLKKILEALARPVHTQEQMKSHEAQNLEFHRALFEISASTRLSEMYDKLHAHIQIARIHASEGPNFPALRARLAQEQLEHQAIVDAILDKSAAAVDEAIRTHILRARNSLVSALETAEAAPAPESPAKKPKAARA